MGKQLIIHFVGFCWLTGFKGTCQLSSAYSRCDNPLLCPEHATCTNTGQDYYCTCRPGFLSTSGDTNFTDPTIRCNEDVCTDASSCPAFSDCKNIPGGYHCTCKSGFVSSSGEQHFRDRTVKCNEGDHHTHPPVGNTSSSRSD
ncbi:adhesion G protein-coupled receptor E1-like [Emydura macquarii macquarii]|uniref:adhesion G protein-coupled receptor E1-like n=1 Tax=Emydura macquarii macquarii TaxID=1129001 RepID=UPI00352B8998